MSTRNCGCKWALLLVILGATVTGGERSWAQDTTHAMSASLLRRLGEAVDGYRTGYPEYVVAQFEFPHEVLGVFASRAQALQVAEQGGPGFDVFGPYTAPRDIGEEPYILLVRHVPDTGIGPLATKPPSCPGGGIHRPDTYCPPRDSSRAVVALPVSQVRDITISVRMLNGRQYVSTYLPQEIDAVFLTLAAFDKFAIPYYTAVFGADYAAGIRRDYVQLLERADK